ncbi:MAG TPA: HK97 family phage prohead protease, partial [Pseudolabrys sp.]|nr:HK97 family phage prohead protease [Pseudolabrys sp.]
MAVKFKSLPLADFQVKFAADNSATIEGYASTFGNMDTYRDIVMPGAFKESIGQKMPAMLYQHCSDRICGIWNSAI